jgi:hypothetical protein
MPAAALPSRQALPESTPELHLDGHLSPHHFLQK